MERVRLIAGELTIESNPGRGSRLEIQVPKNREATMDNKRSQTIRIVIADDHPIFRDGLRRLLEAEPDLKVIGEAPTAARRLSWHASSSRISCCSIWRCPASPAWKPCAT